MGAVQLIEDIEKELDEIEEDGDLAFVPCRPAISVSKELPWEELPGLFEAFHYEGSRLIQLLKRLRFTAHPNVRQAVKRDILRGLFWIFGGGTEVMRRGLNLDTEVVEVITDIHITLLSGLIISAGLRSVARDNVEAS